MLPSFARALPVDLVGFGDSITDESFPDGSYLDVLESWGRIDSASDANHGVPADRSQEVSTRLTAWIDDDNTADFLILLTGTPDTYQAVGGFKNVDYDADETEANIQAMVDLVLDETTIPLILVAPPPVVAPCDYPDVLTCGEIDARLADLASRLAPMADPPGVRFLDLYAAFKSHDNWAIDPSYFYMDDDGTHPRLETGDLLIAGLLAPMVPEPSTALLLGSGLLMLGARRLGTTTSTRRSPQRRP
jgi:lysophospholipase L1-like esterase